MFAALHAALRFWTWAVRPVQALWTVLAATPVALLWHDPRLAFASASVPGAVALWLAVQTPRAKARPGDRESERANERVWGDRCSICGSADARVVAPMWIVSLVFATMRQPGTPDVVCPRHARLKAIPATVVSALLGW